MEVRKTVLQGSLVLSPRQPVDNAVHEIGFPMLNQRLDSEEKNMF